jgi:hypothetical protein
MKYSKTLLAAALMLTVGLAHAAETKQCMTEATFAKSVALSRDAGMPAHQLLKNVNQQPFIGSKTRLIGEGIPKRVAAGIVANVYDAHDLTPDQSADAAYQVCITDEA